LTAIESFTHRDPGCFGIFFRLIESKLFAAVPSEMI
jgi:hypothetical protein